MKCQKCQKEIFLPFKCPYCGGYFCSEHRLPENHECAKLEFARAPKGEPLSKTMESYGEYGYTVTYIPVEHRRRFGFSLKEVKHLSLAALLVFGIGLSFRVAMNNIGMLLTFSLLVVASFLFHELAHKFAAQREGLWAEFRLVTWGVILTAISIFSPFFKIISPGVVLTSGFTRRESVGKISVAGPIANIALATVLMAASIVTLHPILIYLVAFNAWIALFNLIPLGMLDGLKVLQWNKIVWAATFLLSLALTILTIFRF